jgi:uncharacterized damage-inducible protein DinB
MSPLALLLHQLDTAYDHKAWHGPTLKGALRGVDERLASWRPAKGRHTIWELAVHCAYWKYAVRRRIAGEKRGAFPLDGSNWFRRPDGAARWDAERKLLDAEHAALREVVAALDPAALGRAPEGSAHTLARQIAGVAAHDLYHAGQIQLMKRLADEAALAAFR